MLEIINFTDQSGDSYEFFFFMASYNGLHISITKAPNIYSFTAPISSNKIDWERYGGNYNCSNINSRHKLMSEEAIKFAEDLVKLRAFF